MTFGIAQHLRSARAGARPGDGTIRALLDGEFFNNTADNVICLGMPNGAMQTFYQLNAAGMKAFVATLSTTPPTTPGQLWLDSGMLAVS